MSLKKVFLDTNVVIDYIAQRKPFSDFADQIFFLIQEGKINAYTSTLTISTTQYVISKLFSKSKCHSILDSLVTVLELIDFKAIDVKNVLSKSDFIDMEDLFQHTMALRSDVDCIITRDRKGFNKNGGIKILKPEEFLKIYDN